MTQDAIANITRDCEGANFQAVSLATEIPSRSLPHLKRGWGSPVATCGPWRASRGTPRDSSYSLMSAKGRFRSHCNRGFHAIYRFRFRAELNGAVNLKAIQKRGSRRASVTSSNGTSGPLQSRAAKCRICRAACGRPIRRKHYLNIDGSLQAASGARVALPSGHPRRRALAG